MEETGEMYPINMHTQRFRDFFGAVDGPRDVGSCAPLDGVIDT